eukprot:Hpha_TRINITY_DN22298_c0_g1::TRINITY_DN22298_c0_g1_i1::g.167130::m.167130
MAGDKDTSLWLAPWLRKWGLDPELAAKLRAANLDGFDELVASGPAGVEGLMRAGLDRHHAETISCAVQKEQSEFDSGGEIGLDPRAQLIWLQGKWISLDTPGQVSYMEVASTRVYDVQECLLGELQLGSRGIQFLDTMVRAQESSRDKVVWEDDDVWVRYGTRCDICGDDTKAKTAFCVSCGADILRTRKDFPPRPPLEEFKPMVLRSRALASSTPPLTEPGEPPSTPAPSFDGAPSVSASTPVPSRRIEDGFRPGDQIEGDDGTRWSLATVVGREANNRYTIRWDHDPENEWTGAQAHMCRPVLRGSWVLFLDGKRTDVVIVMAASKARKGALNWRREHAGKTPPQDEVLFRTGSVDCGGFGRVRLEEEIPNMWKCVFRGRLASTGYEITGEVEVTGSSRINRFGMGLPGGPKRKFKLERMSIGILGQTTRQRRTVSGPIRSLLGQWRLEDSENQEGVKDAIFTFHKDSRPIGPVQRERERRRDEVFVDVTLDGEEMSSHLSRCRFIHGIEQRSIEIRDHRIKENKVDRTRSLYGGLMVGIFSDDENVIQGELQVIEATNDFSALLGTRRPFTLRREKGAVIGRTSRASSSDAGSAVDTQWHEGVWQHRAPKVNELGDLYFRISKDKVQQVRWDWDKGKTYPADEVESTELLKVYKRSIDLKEYNRGEGRSRGWEVRYAGTFDGVDTISGMATGTGKSGRKLEPWSFQLKRVGEADEDIEHCKVPMISSETPTPETPPSAKKRRT